MNIAVFASGGGTDFQSIIDGVESGLIDARINMLVASKAGIGAIERAIKHKIPAYVYAKTDFSSPEKMFENITALLKENETDLIVLAGYLTILPASFVEAFAGRIINIHPSLLPKFGGKGMYGLKVHEAVIAAGEKESGCTVHYVDAGADTGKIIAQARVKVENDTPESLQQKVLTEEHKLLPRVVAELIKEMRK